MTKCQFILHGWKMGVLYYLFYFFVNTLFRKKREKRKWRVSHSSVRGDSWKAVSRWRRGQGRREPHANWSGVTRAEGGEAAARRGQKTSEGLGWEKRPCGPQERGAFSIPEQVPISVRVLKLNPFLFDDSLNPTKQLVLNCCFCASSSLTVTLKMPHLPMSADTRGDPPKPGIYL